ncbi:SHOCT domain-containing protein [Halorubrum sp. SP9]|uniref:SHOCT domain-containing protein n=1 Tax=Halorubrum sp. SP9 TaxID=1537267 RepID=UPI0010F6511B|nr:SHOCT domain-containing protein [Halorubrum sp. SP9]TKX71046.1 SHOCT domain-containing protein [Halorubrum sp. SP9]
MALPTFEKKRLIGLIAILSFGLTSLLAVLLPTVLGALIPAVFITGFFILIPLVLVLGEDFPLVASDDDAAPADETVGSTNATAADHPVAALREWYATGEIDEAEFERRLDRLLATEDLDERFDRIESDRGEEPRERDLELE